MSKRVLKAQEAERIEEEWGTVEWVASRKLTGSDVTVGRVVIRPGCHNPRHVHHTCQEVLHLLSGCLVHTLGDDVVRLEAGDTIVVPAGMAHNARNVGESDAEMIVAYSSGERDFAPTD